MSASYQPWLLALDTPAGIPVAAANSKVQIRLNHELQAETIKPIDQPFRYTATSILSDRFTPANFPRSENLLTTSTNPRARACPESAQRAQERHRYRQCTVAVVQPGKISLHTESTKAW